ncbi:hypothetical protein AR438_00745 [Chryseobacterium aquaticum]|uniref:Uncharacterized protein n=1 Tax=Chryseobacterium aquaticum TaxID=452084 RepID=A0A0Q3HVY8_9FLAO|nr:hypothetical protein AR438_00745 [Chryseobacterium aquaticum]
MTNKLLKTNLLPILETYKIIRYILIAIILIILFYVLMILGSSHKIPQQKYLKLFFASLVVIVGMIYCSIKIKKNN